MCGTGFQPVKHVYHCSRAVRYHAQSTRPGHTQWCNRDMVIRRPCHLITLSLCHRFFRPATTSETSRAIGPACENRRDHPDTQKRRIDAWISKIPSEGQSKQNANNGQNALTHYAA